ncbi:ribosomal RNA small subunit methyltransferase A [Candidatus Parcubacteria bacterium]|nr:MAG: ribosomal RNA small subunit methyltransferase A [Candidatus Parcubacteria bacterium]
MTKKELDILLKKYNLTPNKIRGQNFLISDQVLTDIIGGADLSKDDLVLEVGPGLGALTVELIKTAGQVVAFEVDKNFARPLNKLKDVATNLEIIWQDILSLSDDFWQEVLFKYKKQDYKIVANIPYYLTNKFIQKFIMAANKPESMTLMVQKEVAERIVAKDAKQSLLSLSVAFYGQAKFLRLVTKDNFYPAPEVDSAIIHIFGIKAWPYEPSEKKTWQLVKRGFSSKRKKLINNLLSDPALDKNQVLKVFSDLKLDNNIRAEKLSTQNWLDLAVNL